MQSRLFCLLQCFLYAWQAMQAQNGLKADYFNGTNFDQFVTSRIETKIDQAWNDKPPVRNLDPHDCSIRYTGFLKAPETGVFTFSAKVDDGIRVWLGDRLIIDQWKLNDNGAFEAAVQLKAGENYKLKVEYFNALVEGEIQLIWSKPSDKSMFGTYFSNSEVVGHQHFNHEISQILPKSTNPKPATAPEKNPKTEVKPTPTPKKEPLKPDLKASQISADTLERYVPENVHFIQSKAIILPESKAALDQLAGFLRRYPRITATIEGHTDVIGEAAVNQKLSEERAKTVADYLAEKGVASNRLRTVGYGSTRPLYNNDTAQGDARNRRVVFILE
jgi:outer membrane protein OmpA-like peptidoglycan-associated protein